MCLISKGINLIGFFHKKLIQLVLPKNKINKKDYILVKHLQLLLYL